MIEFTIKTLDSNNHRFSVDDEITVQQLKEKVLEQMGIEIHLQRLIFCGRVLQDEKRLSDYDVHGKVVHLVQRAPPGPESRSERAAHSATSGTPSTEPGGLNMPQHIRRLMTNLSGPSDPNHDQLQVPMSPTTGRLEFIRRLISDVRASLTTLRHHVNHEENTPARSDAPVEPPDTEPITGATQEESEPQIDDNGDDSQDGPFGRTNATRRRAIRALRARHSRPRDLGQLIEELGSLQEQFDPYRVDYIRTLRAANSPEQPRQNLTETERQHAQQTVDMVCDIMHSFAHAYHAVSDINFQVGQSNPRLTSESTIIRRPLPMQAHISVMQSNRRSSQQPQAGTNAPANTAGGGGTSTTYSAPPTDTNNQDSQQSRTLPGRNPAQPNVNISIQPDPITYQVEIETRVPISFPLENAFTGLNASIANNQNQTRQSPPTQTAPQTGSSGQTGPVDQPSLNNQTPPVEQPGQVGQGSQAGQTSQANRQQVLLDFENLFRGLGALGGVEVVMSMEELPHGGPLGVGTMYSGINTSATGTDIGNATGTRTATGTPTAATTGLNIGIVPGTGTATATVTRPTVGTGPNNIGQQNTINEAEVYVPAPISTIVLQHFVDSIMGQMQLHGATHHIHHVPSETIAVTPMPQFLTPHQQAHFQQLLQTHFPDHNIPTNVPTQQPAPQTQEPATQTQQPAAQTQQPAAQTQPAAQMQQPAAQTQQQAAETQQPAAQSQQPVLNAQPTQDSSNPVNRNTQPHLHVRRATTTRAQALPLANCIYDRYLQCDSPHARRRVQRRREQQQQHVAVLERVRVERAATQNIAVLRDRNINLTENHLETMLQLLDSHPNHASWVNALFVTMARHFYLRDPLHPVSGEPQLVPTEFIRLRGILRHYIEDLITRSGHAQEESAYLDVSDYFVDQHGEFINEIPELTPIRSDIDLYESIRALVRSQLPAVIGTVLCENTGQMFAASFYAIFSRFFIDCCALISNCLDDGTDGLRVVHRRFLEYVTRYCTEPIRQLFQTLGQANFNAALNHMTSSNIQEYVRHRDALIVPMEPDVIVNDSTTVEIPEPQSGEGLGQITLPITPTVTVTQPRAASPVAVVVEPVTSQASTSTVTSASATPAHTVTSASTRSPMSSPSRTNARASKEKCDLPPQTRAANREENLRLVPPLMIVQHWGEEWVPVFTRDQQAQAAEPQEPYSDAYLSGMPSRKRRCVRQARPPTTLDAFMNESVREAAAETAPMDNSAMRHAFREHMRNIARTRASSDDEYDPRQYVSAARFLNPPRSNVLQPQENGNMNKDVE